MGRHIAAELEVEGRKIRVSNLDKVLYPATGFTKADVIQYYIKIAPVLLPHVRNRALTLKRYPDGVQGQFFYEKNCPGHRPSWVSTVPIWSEGNRRMMHFCLVNDVATLVWAANLADLELHTSLACAKTPLRPDLMVFDLDPGPPADIVLCCEVALLVREVLEEDGLKSYPKTSGSKGLQLYVPLSSSGITFANSKAYAHDLAKRLEQNEPRLVIARMQKALRAGKVFVDWSQNDDHKTTVCAYSLRAKEMPTVSTPVTWREVEHCLSEKDPATLVFTSDEVLKRVAKYGDLFETVLKNPQKLPNPKEFAHAG